MHVWRHKYATAGLTLTKKEERFLYRKTSEGEKEEITPIDLPTHSAIWSARQEQTDGELEIFDARTSKLS